MKLTFYVRDTSEVQPTLLTSGTVSVNIAPDVGEVYLLKSKASFMVHRIQASEFYPAHKRCLEHSAEYFEVLQSACRAHEGTQSDHRDIQKAS